MIVTFIAVNHGRTDKKSSLTVEVGGWTDVLHVPRLGDLIGGLATLHGDKLSGRDFVRQVQQITWLDQGRVEILVGSPCPMRD